jgi:hypothetical protein
MSDQNHHQNWWMRGVLLIHDCKNGSEAEVEEIKQGFERACGAEDECSVLCVF